MVLQYTITGFFMNIDIYYTYYRARVLCKGIAHWAAYSPPGSLTAPGWNAFNKEFKEKAPVRYWFKNNFRRKFILPIKWKADKMYWWVRYRTINRFHVVKTGLPPGYKEVETTMLHVNFTLLKDFVEIELASQAYWGDDIVRTWAEKYIPLYNVFYPFRRPDLGIKQLEWAAKLDDPSVPVNEQSPAQAVHAREVYALYKRWTETRPNRVTVEILYPKVDRSEDDFMFTNVDRTTEEYKTYMHSVDMEQKQQEKWEKEDTKMLVRLMKARTGMWT